MIEVPQSKLPEPLIYSFDNPRTSNAKHITSEDVKNFERENEVYISPGKKMIFAYPANDITAAYLPHERHASKKNHCKDSAGLGRVFEANDIHNHGIPTVSHSERTLTQQGIQHYIALLYTYAAQGHVIVLPAHPQGDKGDSSVRFAFFGGIAGGSNSDMDNFLQQELQKFYDFIKAYNANNSIMPDLVYQKGFQNGLEDKNTDFFVAYQANEQNIQSKNKFAHVRQQPAPTNRPLGNVQFTDIRKKKAVFEEDKSSNIPTSKKSANKKPRVQSKTTFKEAGAPKSRAPKVIPQIQNIQPQILSDDIKDVVLEKPTENELLGFIRVQLGEICDNLFNESKLMQLVCKAFYQLQINCVEKYCFFDQAGMFVRQEGDGLNLIQQLFNGVCDLQLHKGTDSEFEDIKKLKALLQKFDDQKRFEYALTMVSYGLDYVSVEVPTNFESNELAQKPSNLNSTDLLTLFGEFQTKFELCFLSISGKRFPDTEELLQGSKGKMPILVKFKDENIGDQQGQIKYYVFFVPKVGGVDYRELSKNYIIKALTQDNIMEELNNSETVSISGLKNKNTFQCIMLAEGFVPPVESTENKYDFFNDEGRAQKQKGDNLAPVQQLFNHCADQDVEKAITLAKEILLTFPPNPENAISPNRETILAIEKKLNHIELPAIANENQQEDTLSTVEDDDEAALTAVFGEKAEEKDNLDSDAQNFDDGQFLFDSGGNSIIRDIDFWSPDGVELDDAELALLSGASQQQAAVETEVPTSGNPEDVVAPSPAKRAHNFSSDQPGSRRTMAVVSKNDGQDNPKKRPASAMPAKQPQNNKDVDKKPKKALSPKLVQGRNISSVLFALPKADENIICSFIFSQMIEVMPELKNISVAESPNNLPLPPPPSVVVSQPAEVDPCMQQQPAELLPPPPLGTKPEARILTSEETQKHWDLMGAAFRHLQENNPEKYTFFDSQNNPIQQTAIPREELSLAQRLFNQSINIPGNSGICLRIEDGQKLARECGYELVLTEITTTKEEETEVALLNRLLSDRVGCPALVKLTFADGQVRYGLLGKSNEGKYQFNFVNGIEHFGLDFTSSSPGASAKKIFVSLTENKGLYNKIHSNEYHIPSKLQMIQASIEEPMLGFVYSQLLEFCSTGDKKALDYAWQGFHAMQMEGQSSQHYHHFFEGTSFLADPIYQEDNNLAFIQQLFNHVFKIKKEGMNQQNGSYNLASIQSLKGFLDLHKPCNLLPNQSQIKTVKNKFHQILDNYQGKSQEKEVSLSPVVESMDEENSLKTISHSLRSSSQAKDAKSRIYYLEYALQTFYRLQQVHSPECYALYVFDNFKMINPSTIPGNAIILVRDEKLERGSVPKAKAYFIKNNEFVKSGSEYFVLSGVPLPLAHLMLEKDNAKFLENPEINQIKQNILLSAGFERYNFFNEAGELQEQLGKDGKLSPLEYLFNCALNFTTEMEQQGHYSLESRANLDWMVSKILPVFSLEAVCRELNKVVSDQFSAEDRAQALIAVAEIYRKSDSDNVYFDKAGLPKVQEARSGQQLTLEQEIFNRALSVWSDVKLPFVLQVGSLEDAFVDKKIQPLKQVLASVRTEKTVLREICDIFYYFAQVPVADNISCKQKIQKIFSLFKQYYAGFFDQTGQAYPQKGQNLTFAQELFNCCIKLKNQIENPSLSMDVEKLRTQSNDLFIKSKFAVCDEMARDHLLRFICKRLWDVVGLTPKRFGKERNIALREVWKAFYLLQINSQSRNDRQYCFFNVENGNTPQKQEGENLTFAQELFNGVFEILSHQKADATVLRNLRGILVKQLEENSNNPDFQQEVEQDGKEWLSIIQYIQAAILSATPCPRSPEQNAPTVPQIKIHNLENQGAIATAFRGMIENIVLGYFDTIHQNIALLEKLKGKAAEETVQYFNQHQVSNRNDWTLLEIDEFKHRILSDISEIERAQREWVNLFNENKIENRVNWTFPEIKLYFTSHYTYQSQQEMLDKFVPLLKIKAIELLDIEAYKAETIGGVIEAFLAYYASLAGNDSQRVDNNALYEVYIKCPAVKQYFDELCAAIANEHGYNGGQAGSVKEFFAAQRSKSMLPVQPSEGHIRHLRFEWHDQGLAEQFMSASADYRLLAPVCSLLGFNLLNHENHQINRDKILIKRSDFRGDINSENLIGLLINYKIVKKIDVNPVGYELMVPLNALKNKLQTIVKNLLSGKFSKLTQSHINKMLENKILEACSQEEGKKRLRFTKEFSNKSKAEKCQMLGEAFDAGSAFNEIPDYFATDYNLNLMLWNDAETTPEQILSQIVEKQQALPILVKRPQGKNKPAALLIVDLSATGQPQIRQLDIKEGSLSFRIRNDLSVHVSEAEDSELYAAIQSAEGHIPFCPSLVINFYELCLSQMAQKMPLTVLAPTQKNPQWIYQPSQAPYTETTLVSHYQFYLMADGHANQAPEELKRWLDEQPDMPMPLLIRLQDDPGADPVFYIYGHVKGASTLIQLDYRMSTKKLYEMKYSTLLYWISLTDSLRSSRVLTPDLEIS